MTAQDQLSNQFIVEVAGTPVGSDVAAELMSATIETSLNLPDMFSLTFRDAHRDVLKRGRFRVSAAVAVKVYSKDHVGGEKLVEGEITALEMEVDSQGTFTIVRGLDRSHRLQRRRVTTSHVDMSYSDVARDLAAGAGLKVGTIDPTRQVHRHIAQVNTTDWALLKGLASEVGYEMSVADGSFNFRKPLESSKAPDPGTVASTNPLQLSIGRNLLRCRATVTAADQVKEVEVRGWDPVTKKKLVAQRPAATKSASNGADPSELAAAFKSKKRVSVDVPYATQPEVDAAASALAESVASSFAEIEGVSRGDPRLRAGASISLGLAKEPFDGKYVLTTARHTWTPDEGYLVTFVASGGRDRTVHGLIAGSGDNATGRGNLMSGVAIAVVTDIADPDQRHRVRLKFPWLDDRYESDWARTSHAGAGDKRGWLVLPEVGDEVLVAFQHGDLRRPFVLGGLFNGVDKPDAAATEKLIDGTAGKVNRRSFVSRTGHRLVFIDESSTSAVEVASKGKVCMEAKDEITITSTDAGLKIEASKDISITSSAAGLTIEANKDISITSNGGDVTISGKSVSVKGTSGLTLDGGASTTVKGGTVKIN